VSRINRPTRPDDSRRVELVQYRCDVCGTLCASIHLGRAGELWWTTMPMFKNRTKPGRPPRQWVGGRLDPDTGVWCFDGTQRFVPVVEREAEIVIALDGDGTARRYESGKWVETRPMARCPRRGVEGSVPAGQVADDITAGKRQRVVRMVHLHEHTVR